MIYLDNAATSFPKPKSVIAELNRCVKTYCGNPGRSGHLLALRASEQIYACRERVAELLCIDRPECVSFTQNATHALNIAIKTSITEKCHCIISDLEHNSVIRPLKKVLSRYGGELSVYNSDVPLYEAIVPLIRNDTKYIVSTLASNVTGKRIPINQLSDIAKQYNLGLIVDASQLIGHELINLKDNQCNILCAPGHKSLFGIQGVGFIVFMDDKLRDTLMEGGSGIDSINTEMPRYLPERYEAGTLPTPSIASLSSGIQYITEYGIDNVKNRIEYLTEKLYERISALKDVTVYGKENGIVTFNIKGYISNQISDYLNDYGIYVRSGLHCAPLIHKKLGTENEGSLRVSISILNKIKDLDEIYMRLREL